MERLPVRTFLTGALLGATAAYLWDPRSGARRRAVTRDKAGKYARDAGRWVRGRARVTSDHAQGLRHELAKHAPGYTPSPTPDADTFIKQRVESELGHATHLPLSLVNFDAADGIVRIRGTVPNATGAEEIVSRAAAVEGVRAVVSLMRTPDGTAVGGSAGDSAALAEAPGTTHAHAVREQLMARWPGLSETDIVASEGHLDRLVEKVVARTGQPSSEVRATLEKILLTSS
jgi:hypothetical protein